MKRLSKHTVRTTVPRGNNIYFEILCYNSRSPDILLLASTNMPTMKHQFLALFALILCSGCSKAEISDARMRHLLAYDHGWIDLTVKASPPNLVPEMKECMVALSVNGESFLLESANFAAANAKGNPIGYRLPVPAGQLDVELTYSMCVKKPFTVKQTLALPKDHLATITLEGAKLTLDSTSAYNPASLDGVRAQLDNVRAKADKTELRLSGIDTLVMACLGLNIAGLALLLWRRKRTP